MVICLAPLHCLQNRYCKVVISEFWLLNRQSNNSDHLQILMRKTHYVVKLDVTIDPSERSQSKKQKCKKCLREGH